MIDNRNTWMIEKQMMNVIKITLLYVNLLIGIMFY